MKKYFTFIVIVLLSLVFSSCQNNTTAPKNTFFVSDVAGTWMATGSNFPIQYFILTIGGYITVYDSSGVSQSTYIQNWNPNIEVFDYTIILPFTRGNLYLTFTNPNYCTATFNSQMMTFIK